MHHKTLATTVSPGGVRFGGYTGAMDPATLTISTPYYTGMFSSTFTSRASIAASLALPTMAVGA